jgi:hypothetical protein
MSLIKKHEVTEKKVAANRENQKLCHPVADERRERIRAALLRHGFDLQAEEVAMRALGEEPTHFQELLEELWEEWKPLGAKGREKCDVARASSPWRSWPGWLCHKRFALGERDASAPAVGTTGYKLPRLSIMCQK